MANYDVIETYTLPVFNYFIRDTANKPFDISAPPYTTMEVPVYEYSGQTSAFDKTKVDGYLLTSRLQNIYNAGDFANEAYLGILQDFPAYPNSNTYGYWLEYYNNNFGAGDWRYGGDAEDGAAVIKSPSSGKYFLVAFPSGASPVFYGALDSTFTINKIVDYVGETLKPSIPEPDKIIIRPYVPRTDPNTEIQFNGFYVYEGVEVPVTPEMGKWGLKDADDTISISDNGLVTIGNTTLESFIVTLTWQGEPIGKQAQTTVYLSGPYSPGGNSGPGGGGGSYGGDESSDNISGDIPDGTVANDCRPSEMFTKYLCNSSYLDLVGEWLWADGDNLGLAIAQGVISKIFGSPSEALFELLSFPFNFSGHAYADRTSGFLTWGNFTSNVPATILTDSGIKIDWGTIELSEYWGNFLDYSPHTKIELYLPWGTGFVSIDPGQCLPGTLQVITNVELSKGSCIHNVIGNDGCVIGTYAGQCGKQLPMSASDFASKVVGAVTAAAGAISVGAVAGASLASAASAYGASSPTKYGGIPVKYIGMERGKYSDYARFGTVDPSPYLSEAAEATSRAGKVASKISSASLAVNRIPTHVSRNGGFTDGSSALGVQYPYIILSRPEQSIPEKYGRYFGYPSNIYERLALVKGYTEIGSIHLDGLGGALEPELVELENILKGGVIL